MSIRRLKVAPAAVVCFVFLVASSGLVSAEKDAEFDKMVRPLLKQHCFACHGEEEQEARIRYDEFVGYDFEQRHLWTKVHEMLSTGQMPPKDHPQPSAAENKQILNWIEKQATAAQQELGTGSLRRLNRRELSAALQHLTGLSVNYAAALPGDGSVNGFDTGAEGLQDAADSVAQTMEVTRRAVEGIYFIEPPASQTLILDLREGKDPRKAFEPWKALGISAKPRGFISPEAGLLIEPKWLGEKGSLDIDLPETKRRGVLRLKLTLSAVKHHAGVPNPHLWVEVGAQDIDFLEVTAQPKDPQVVIYEVQLNDLAVGKKGLRISLGEQG